MLVDRRSGFRLGGRNDGLGVRGRGVTAADAAGCPFPLREPQDERAGLPGPVGRGWGVEF